jgi:hypothetical protein
VGAQLFPGARRRTHSLTALTLSAAHQNSNQSYWAQKKAFFLQFVITVSPNSILLLLASLN